MPNKYIQSAQTYIKRSLATIIICGLVLSFLNAGAVVKAQADFCNGLSGEFAGFLDCSNSFSSFTEFQGGLTAPDTEGYDESLTEATDIKTFAKNITNFALGFLGLIAVLIIVYSGFKYVTSNGSEDQAGEAKKGITYALIGILIIFASYAIVNTILQAPGGDGTNIRQQAGVRGSGPDGTNRAQLANFNSAAEEVKKVTNDLLRSYQKSYELAQKANKLTNYKPNKWTKRSDFLDYLQYLKNELQTIRSQAGFTSDTYLATNYILNNLIDPSIVAVNQLIQGEKIQELNNTIGENNFSNMLDDVSRDIEGFFNENFGNSRSVQREYNCALPPEERSVLAGYEDCAEGNDVVTGAFVTTISAIAGGGIGAAIGGTGGAIFFGALGATAGVIGSNESSALNDDNQATTNLNIEQSGMIIDQLFDASIRNLLIDNGIKTDFGRNIEIYESRLLDIRRNIDATGILSEGNKFDDAIDKIGFEQDEDIFKLSARLPDTEDVSSIFGSYITNAANALKDLYTYLTTLRFTVPIIRADTVAGNAPLIVNFDGALSYDPANQSIAEANFTWDPINGATEDAVECFQTNLNQAAISCVFKRPGVYLPKLTVKSSSTDTENPIVSGVAYQTISVSAPTAKIQLKAVTGGVDSTLRQYDENGNLLVDINEYSVTLEQAKAGIKFDATGTDTESGSDGRRITKYQWIFNDTGLSVTGSGNSSGTRSNGEVAISDTGTTISENAKTITRKFSKRGMISAQLVVTDTQGNIDRKLFTIRVTDLVARITMANAQSTGTPGEEFKFDASASRSDVSPNLAYKWKIEDEGPGGLDNFEQTSFSSENETFDYKFKAPGKKKVTVEVQVDGSGGGKTDSFTQEITINSQKPSALFEVTFPEKTNRPSYVVLDAANSFDPDEGDTLKYSWRMFNATPGVDYEIISGAEAFNNPNVFTDNPKVELIFKRKGVYKIELVVQDQYEPSLRQTSTINRDVTINTVIDVKFADSQTYAAQLQSVTGGALQANVNFDLESKNAESVSINFGDNSTPKVERFSNGKLTVSHTYTRAGSYEVTLKARKGDEMNEAKALIIIGGGDQPVAIPRIKIGNAFAASLEDLPEIYREAPITFDAASSLNSDATSSNLSYSWNMGDGRAYSTSVVTHTFTDLPPSTPGFFEVRLTVTDNRDVTKSDTRVIPIKVVGAKPQIQTIIAEIEGNDDTTPVNVNVEVVAPRDRDGTITKYRYYYFPINDQTRELGVKESTSNKTTLTLNTFGQAGAEVEYAICVDIEDSDENEVKCKDLFPDGKYTTVKVTNGRNDPPTVDFRVDRTNVKVGETVNFYDLSRDTDGRIIEWVYDLEGDNSFVNNTKYEQGNISHTFTKKSPRDGYNVRLRVTDDKGSSAVSQSRKIYVDGVLDAPTALFTYVTQDDEVQFSDKSTVDTANGGTIASYKWDFNALVDSDGDGNAKNDADSTVKNPKHTYASSGIYEVNFTVTDSESNEATISRQVVVQKISAGKANPFANAESATTVTDTTNLYKDILRTVPARSASTGAISLTGETAKVRFDFSHLPATTKRIILDRNIYFDTNSGDASLRNYGPGDGVRNNDIDVLSLSLRSFEVTFEKAWSPIRLQIAVEDASGKIYTDQADVVFGNAEVTATDLQAALKYNPVNNLPAFIYFIILFGISVSSTFIIKLRDKKFKRKI
jgi:PKD repeat protein